MSEAFTKEDLSFLVEAMDKKAAGHGVIAMAAMADVGSEPGEAKDQVHGDMTIPKPLEVNVTGTMSTEDYKKCAMVMAVCQNMVQKTITDAAQAEGVEVTEALKNMQAWVRGYTHFPFPFFNFKDTQNSECKRDDFVLNADPTVVEQIVNIKGLDGLKESVVGALKASGGDIAKYSNTDKDFNYFGVITAYNETEIALRVIKYQMKMKNTDVEALCVKSTKTHLESYYDTYQFVCDKDLMIKMQSKMGDKMVEYMADKLLDFVKAFYDEQLVSFRSKIGSLFK